MSSLLAFSILSVVLPVAAQDTKDIQDAASDSENKESVEGTNADLLLFWEEKELYVETATRTAKPISQVAENMEVVTAKDIEEMNAHTVNEVLNRIPGLFVNPEINDFGSPAQIQIQGSSSRHVTVLLDGVVWNFLSDGHAETFTIPVGIIDRIEIIKGPASSAWGSALGGVINIITKNVGSTTIPKGTVTASYGEADSRDLRGELFGKGGPLGYYLYAGQLASDGLRNNRNSRTDSLYGKVTLSPSSNLDLLFTAGYSTPDINGGILRFDYAAPVGPVGFGSRMFDTTCHATANFDYRISPDFDLKGSVNTLRTKFDQPNFFATSNAFFNVQPGDIFKRPTVNERSVSGGLRFTYSGSIQTAVVGADFSHGTMDLNMEQRTPTTVISSPTSARVDKWAIFGNDTIAIGKVVVTPGLRLDHNSISGSFISPSIGATYELTEHTIARASVARGFTYPSLAMTAGGGLFWSPNPNVTAERGWSYQTGVESAFKDYLNVKATLFRHDISNAISDEPVSVDPTQLPRYINVGRIVRQGYEVELESAPFYNVSFKAANAYVHIAPESSATSTDNYSYQLGLKYDDRKLLAQLLGTYVWWDLPASAGAKYDNFIWDASVSRKFKLAEGTTLEAFLAVHNIFSAGYYVNNLYPNPSRWVEGGLKLKF